MRDPVDRTEALRHRLRKSRRVELKLIGRGAKRRDLYAAGLFEPSSARSGTGACPFEEEQGRPASTFKESAHALHQQV